MNLQNANPLDSARSRHDWLWALTPLAILLYMVTVTAWPAGQFAPPDERASTFYVLMALSLALTLLSVQWMNRTGDPFLPKPALPRMLMITPGLAGGFLALALLPSASGAPSPVSTLQLLFIVTIASLLLATMVRVVWRQSPPYEEARIRTDQSGVGEWRGYLQMMKPGLNGLVLVSTLVGFLMAGHGDPDPWLCLRTLLGTGLAAAGASVLNQYIERRPDAFMARTARRPLPQGRVSPPRALVFGVILSVTGMFVLSFSVNLLTGFLATVSLATYLFLYTPLKQVNSLSTLAGAISGALPPVIGWTGTGRPVQPAALALFFTLFLWQIPHFLAIGWKYREQYRAAGFPMYCVQDPSGRLTALQSILYALVLLPVSMMISFHNLTGLFYLAGALVLGLAFVLFAVAFAWRPTPGRARALFFASIGYLPLLFICMVLDKTSR